jgi:hypothetical protein
MNSGDADNNNLKNPSSEDNNQDSSSANEDHEEDCASPRTVGLDSSTAMDCSVSPTASTVDDYVITTTRSSSSTNNNKRQEESATTTPNDFDPAWPDGFVDSSLLRPCKRSTETVYEKQRIITLQTEYMKEANFIVLESDTVMNCIYKNCEYWSC